MSCVQRKDKKMITNLEATHLLLIIHRPVAGNVGRQPPFELVRIILTFYCCYQCPDRSLYAYSYMYREFSDHPFKINTPYDTCRRTLLYKGRTTHTSRIVIVRVITYLSKDRD